MGAGNVKRVFIRWGDLPGNAFRLLTYMALRTKDGDPQPTFWAGRDELAWALGRHVPEGDDPASRRARDAAYQAVKEAIRTLTRRGAITTLERARPGRNAVYLLRLDRRAAVDTPPPIDELDQTPAGDAPAMGEENPPSYGVGKSSPMGEENPPQWGRETLHHSPRTGEGNPPPEDEYLQRNRGQRRGVGGVGSHQPDGDAHARARARSEQDQQQTKKIRFTRYRDAAAYLLTVSGALRDRVVADATAELGPGASREAVLIRAANLAYGSVA